MTIVTRDPVIDPVRFFFFFFYLHLNSESQLIDDASPFWVSKDTAVSDALYLSQAVDFRQLAELWGITSGAAGIPL